MKNGLVMNWYSFLGHEYSYLNVIVSRLIAKKKWGLETSPGIYPRPQAAITIAFVLYKTQSSSTKRTLVKAFV